MPRPKDRLIGVLGLQKRWGLCACTGCSELRNNVSSIYIHVHTHIHPSTHPTTTPHYTSTRAYLPVMSLQLVQLSSTRLMSAASADRSPDVRVCVERFLGLCTIHDAPPPKREIPICHPFPPFPLSPTTPTPTCHKWAAAEVDDLQMDEG